MKDMQNEKHPPLANVHPLSSFAFLILSSLFSFFTGGHFSEVICRHWTQNRAHTVLERENKGEKKIVLVRMIATARDS